MSKYIFTLDDGSRFVADLDEDEAAMVVAAMAANDDDDDEDQEEDDEEDDDPDHPAAPGREADTPTEFARVEEVYRKERAAIRATRDAQDLVLRRAGMERVLRDQRQSNIAHTRARDLLGEIEQRELRLRADRLAERGQ